MFFKHFPTHVFQLDMFFSPNSSKFHTLQVKIEASHHIQVEDGWKATKTLVFVLDDDDAPTESKKNVKEDCPFQPTLPEPN